MKHLALGVASKLLPSENGYEYKFLYLKLTTALSDHLSLDKPRLMPVTNTCYSEVVHRRCPARNWHCPCDQKPSDLIYPTNGIFSFLHRPIDGNN